MIQEKKLLNQIPDSEVVFITDKPKLLSLDGKSIDPLARCRVLLRSRENGRMLKEYRAIYVGSEEPGVYTFEDTNGAGFFRLTEDAIIKKAASLLNEPDLSVLDKD